MIKKLHVNKKKVGLLTILFFLIIILGIFYSQYGFKELKKNETEEIFVEDIKSNKNLDENQSNEEKIIQVKDKNIVVEIKGEVRKPDVYILEENSIIKELIDVAGGLTENADLSNINRAKRLQNHELIYIGNKNDIRKGGINENSALNSNKDSGVNNKIVNINSATIEELKTLDGIGDSKAKSIIEYRESNGGFKSIEDIKNVTGIGDKMFDRIKELIEV